jgi:hypothetical protein
MAELSLIELFVYGLVCYAGVLGLIFSAFRESPSGRCQSSLRIIWLIPSLFAAFMLGSAGEQVNLEDSTITSIQTNLNTTEVWSETVTTNNTMTLVNPVWVTLHTMFFLILLIYILVNILALLVKH